MIQLLLHLLGDYFLQNDWMAVNKNKYSFIGWVACYIHCILYALPFLFYYHNSNIFFWVYITHLSIDKFSLAKYVTRIVNWRWDFNWDGVGNETSFDLGFDSGRPAFITVWIHIIRDNSMHIACNYFIIQHFLSQNQQPHH